MQFLNCLTLHRWSKWYLLSRFSGKVEGYGSRGHTEVYYWETSMSNACMLSVTCNSRNNTFPDAFCSVLPLLQKWIYVQLSLSQIEVFILLLLLEWILVSKLSYIQSVITAK